MFVADLVFIGVLVAFFAVALLFVKGCDRIIGPDIEVMGDEAEADADQGIAA
jgi:hypothetical protein